MNKINKYCILFLFFLILTNKLNAHEKFNFFGVELGVPLKNENLLTGDWDFFFEVFEPKVEFKNKTFDKYLLIRGRLSKIVYGINVTGTQENFGSCIKNKDFYEKIFAKKFNQISREITQNTESIYSHELIYQNDLKLKSMCMKIFDKPILYFSFKHDEEQYYNEDNEYWDKLEKKKLEENDLTGFGS